MLSRSLHRSRYLLTLNALVPPSTAYLQRTSTHSYHKRGLRTLPQFSLEGKTCVVTGAARGLGKEFLTAFALSGARGACVDLTLEGANSSIAEIAAEVQRAQPKESISELRAYACNATIESDVKSTWKRIVDDFGKVDVLVTAAGIVDNVEAENYDFPRWRKMMDINVDG